MTIETQRGATRYRVSPANQHDVQMQTGSGRSWLWHSSYSTPEEAQVAVLRLGRGDTTAEEVGA